MAFATGLEHPRWLYVLPNGDVLVAEADKGTQWADSMGYGGWIETWVRGSSGLVRQKRQQIILLRDTDGDGVADMQNVFMAGLNAPIGMALVGNTLYVADTDALLAFPYHDGETSITDQRRARSPTCRAAPIDHHWTKNVIASKDGIKLYVTIGSNSNAGENGLDKEAGRADIWEVDPKTGAHRVFASGLRNPNGMGWSPDGVLWVAVNERDEIGGDIVPDYMTVVKDGAFYGWPFSYYGQHVDDRVKPQNPAMVARAIAARLRHGRAYRHRWAWPLPMARSWAPPMPAASLSASMARGIASRSMAIASSLCRSRTSKPVGPAAGCADRFPRTPATVPAAGRWMWRSTNRAICWWPMTSATVCGGSAPASSSLNA